MRDQQVRIPRWFIENDPNWSQSLHPDKATLKWNKKGSNLVAVSNPTSLYCDIFMEQDCSFPSPSPSPSSNSSLSSSDDLGYNIPGDQLRSSSSMLGDLLDQNHQNPLAVSDIRKYLSSRHLNPGTHRLPPNFKGFGRRINYPRF
jgi:hypothetical protein